MMSESIFSRQASVLNLMERLQREGVGQLVDLPRMVICGEQSSGKSSVLEALSTIPFPTDDGLCTRFPTELILRRGESNHAIGITPAETRSAEEKKYLSAFRIDHFKPDNFGDVVNKAKNVMGIGEDGKTFVEDILRVEITGPSLPNLTVVDLPGIFHSTAPGQTIEDSKFVIKMVQGYMAHARTIILAVISAKTDVALQQITKYMQRFDPDGKRTIGLLTKPDTIDRDTKHERDCQKLAANQYITLDLGWYIVKNRSFKEKHLTLAQRNQSEADFLANFWPDTPSERKGIESLRIGLADILYRKVSESIPSLLQDAEKAAKDYEIQLTQLEPTHVDTHTIMADLMEASYEFKIKSGDLSKSYRPAKTSLPHGSVDPFDLRQNLITCLKTFAENMKTNGHKYETVRPRHKMMMIEQNGSDSYGNLAQVVEDYIRAVDEIPGHINPAIVSDIFYQQSEKWTGLIDSMKDDVLRTMEDFIVAIIREFCLNVVKTTSANFVPAIVETFVRPKLEELRADLTGKQEQCLAGHDVRLVIDISREITDHIPHAWKDEWTNYLCDRLAMLGLDDSHSQGHISHSPLNSTRIMQALTADLDIVSFTRAETIACMSAYYKEELAKLLHLFDATSIYRSTLKILEATFSRSDVRQLTEVQLRTFGGGGEDHAAAANELVKKISAIEDAVDMLRELQQEMSNGV